MSPKADQQEDEGAGNAGLSFALYQQLRDRIIRHEIPSGQHLDIRRLAEDFSVSAVPVRDAINRLTGEALVQHVPSKGYFVRPISTVGLIEAYDMIFIMLRHSIMYAGTTFEEAGLQRRPDFDRSTSSSEVRVTEETAKEYAIFVESLFERIAALSVNATAVAVTRYFLDRTHYARARDLLDISYLRTVDEYMDTLLTGLTTPDWEKAFAALDGLRNGKLPRLPGLVNDIELQILARDPRFQTGSDDD
ncbi:GntR family transcriptional regulator [Neorhizobium sp. DT-125]|uniref:GntR family transcriptional regulator n=1 Tax=Neorhizobium sp. DT-125 TaxID=3396163 RepID=UPI003F1B5B86